MRLSIATNFDRELVEQCRDYPVTELFGKLQTDVVGGGRAPYQLAKVSRRQLADHVKHIRDSGMAFNYLLNSACMGNREITRKGQKELNKLLDWIGDIGVTAVTVASPLMLQMIKTRQPDLKVRISVFGGVDRVRKAQMWEELGADCIVLDSILVNRELETLQEIRKSVKCDLELMANNNCLTGCAMSPMHMNALAHTGQSWHENKGFFIDWCFLKCTEMKLRNPVHYIRSEWIRPEDLHIYEEMGYDLFKIAERDIPTEMMMTRIRAYTERRYDGNLLDLIQAYGFKGIKENHSYYQHGLSWLLRFIIRPGMANPFRMLPLKRLAELRGMTRPIEGQPPVYIDNRALDGFMERFRTNSCMGIDCEDCLWCHEFAAKAVKINETNRAAALEAYEELFASLHGGSMWSYLPERSGELNQSPRKLHEST